MRLETERLVLRPFEPEDAPTVKTLAGDAAVARTALVPHPYPDGAAEQWIRQGRQAIASGAAYPLAMVRREDGVLVGRMALQIVAEHRRGMLGYWVGQPYWGQGYASEAATRIVTFGFEERELNRIEAGAIASNRASKRVMEKAGLTYEGTLRQYIFHWGAFADMD